MPAVVAASSFPELKKAKFFLQRGRIFQKKIEISNNKKIRHFYPKTFYRGEIS